MSLAEKIRPRHTYLNGTHFRSALEARWSVFFSALDVQWRYEHHRMQVYASEKMHTFIPDFFLPQLGLEVEVKPCWPDYLALTKCVAWAQQRGPILLLHEYPSIPSPDDESHTLYCWSEGLQQVVYRKKMRWVRCFKCGRVGVEAGGGVPQQCRQTCFAANEKFEGEYDEKVKAAFREAQRAVFGRSGR